MSKSRKRLAVAGMALVAFAMLPQDAVEAGFRLRGGPVGVLRSAMGRMLGVAGVHHARIYARSGRARTAALRPQDLREALRGAVDPARPLSNPVLRGQLTAAAALAAWHGGGGTRGWWQHPDGGFGWVGPLFWPFPDDDLADAILWGRGGAFWTYGYSDIHAAVFSPYGAAELAAYADGRRSRKMPPLDRFCGGEPGDSGGLPVERIAQAIQPNEAQRTALEDLASAWRSGAGIIRAHCQTAPAGNGLGRLGVMQGRIEAMIEALAAIEPRLQKFDELLEPKQEKRLAALAARPRDAAAADREKPPPFAACQPPAADRQGQNPPPDDPHALLQAEQQAKQFAASQWPVDDIAAALKLDDIQRAALEVVEDTSLRFLDPLDAGCPQVAPATMPDRLKAVRARLSAMLQAVKSVTDALDDFNYNLSDEQKQQFETLGPKRGV